MSKVLLASDDYRVRLQAAIFMMNNARMELGRLQGLYVKADDRFTRVILGDRIMATTNHVSGWQDYINVGCPLDPRAQITPAAYAHLQEV